MNCSLIIVGETKGGLPFCYEDNFVLQTVDENQMVVSLEFPAASPFEGLQHVCFIEVSFRERGFLYYGFVDLLHTEIEDNVCWLTLAPPQQLKMFQNRRFNRIQLPSPAPLSCRISGVGSAAAGEGITFSGEIKDISAGGLSFTTLSRIFYPLYLELSFVLPGHPHTFMVHAEVVRVSQLDTGVYRVAVEFRNVPESLTHTIDGYCTRSIG
ncbi:flagellar brake protein [Paenibacillus xerothermodurans]|nr:PilZ domain-containing protein [Paenibacillus xerothermodurans]